MEIIKYQLEPEPRVVKSLDPQDDIFLSVEIGNGQLGGNKVTSDGILLAKGNLSRPTFIGKAENFEVKEIEIETNVLDVNAFTNMCVITTTFLNQENQVLFTKIDKGDAPDNGIASFSGKYIVKMLILLVFVFSMMGVDLDGQLSSDKISFQSLETPSSPGFILLDQTPSSIEKPTTPQGLGLSLLGFQSNGGALEVAPFWLKVHPKLTAEEMYKNKFPVLYNFAVSIASIKTDSSNYLSGGIRTRLFQTYGKKHTETLGSIKGQIEDALADLDMERIKELQKEYMDLIEKPLFSVDFAAAIAGGSPTNSFNNLELNRYAAWVSLNWRPKGEDFYITALTRYINNEKYEDYLVDVDLIDLGVRMNYDISEFCFSLEHIQRMNVTESFYDDYRMAVIGSYRLSDNFFITATFGKNFTDVNNIIALAGINFGFSKKEIKAYQ